MAIFEVSFYDNKIEIFGKKIKIILPGDCKNQLIKAMKKYRDMLELYL